MSIGFRVRLPYELTRSWRWRLSAPFRAYVRHSPFRRGTGLLQRQIIDRLLPAGDIPVEVRLPLGAELELLSGELIGRYLMTYGSFEEGELNECARLSGGASCVMDVGANVGIFTLTLAKALAAGGEVVAFEPLPRNLQRLERHVRRNGLDNVRIVPVAVGAAEGVARIDTAVDPAFGRTVGGDGLGSVTTIEVPVRRIDDVWREIGCPDVRFVKIDIEGSELAALAGAKEMLACCRPTLLVEAPTPNELRAMSELLDPLGYSPSQADGFQSWNYLFTAARDA